MRRLGPCFSSGLPVLNVMCGQVSFSSHVLRTPRGLITLPPLFIWRKEEKRRSKMKERPVIDSFLWHNLSQGQVCSWGLHLKTHGTVLECVYMCVSEAANFWWNSLDQRQIASWCHLILSEGYCFAIFWETQLPSPVKSSERTLNKDDVMAWTTTLISCN